MKLAHLNHKKTTEPIWHVQLVILAAIILELMLPNSFSLNFKYLVAGLELLLLIVLSVVSPRIKGNILVLKRSLAIGLLVIITFANVTSLLLVIESLFMEAQLGGRQLLFAALSIYLTNIIVFGLWYWEMDNRFCDGVIKDYDFLFPQDNNDQLAWWSPSLLDYVYISITNATAFSHTDALPLTKRAKMLMSLQSLVSLLTVALILARAVNILV